MTMPNSDRDKRGYLAARAAHYAGVNAIREAVAPAAYRVQSRRPRRNPRPVDMDALYRFVVDYKQGHDGNSPSTREMCAAVDASTSVVWYALRRLERRGLVCLDGDGAARRVKVVGGHWTLEGTEEQ